MEVVMGFVLGAILFVQAWQYLGVSEAKTTGLVAGAGAILLGSLVAFVPFPALSTFANMAVAAYAALWALYAAMLAGVSLWDSESSRGFGLYSLYAAVMALVAVIYLAVSGGQVLPILCQAITVVAFGVVFLYLGLPMKGLRQVTAWILLLMGIAQAVLHGLVLMDVPGLL